MQFYLFVNSFIYLGFALWCLLKFSVTSQFIGYDFFNDSGRVEYLTVYTGLEMGFALFLAVCAYFKRLRAAGLIFCVLTYLFIVVTRTLSGFYFCDLNDSTFIVGGLEYTLFIWGISLLIRHREQIAELRD